MKSFLASLLLVAAVAVPAAAGPDFGAPTPHGKALTASDADRQILPSDDVLFENGSYTLTSTALQRLKVAAKWMKKNPMVRLVIEGHTNSAGTTGYNQSLALERANIVRSHLIALGVPQRRLVTVVYGESEAEASPASTDRRVMLIATRESTDTILAKSQRRGRNLMASR